MSRLFFDFSQSRSLDTSRFTLQLIYINYIAFFKLVITKDELTLLPRFLIEIVSEHSKHGGNICDRSTVYIGNASSRLSGKVCKLGRNVEEVSARPVYWRRFFCSFPGKVFYRVMPKWHQGFRDMCVAFRNKWK